jgi:hypothetical protein
MPQYHYYGGTGFLRRVAGVADPDPIPKLSELTGSPKTAGAFLGEIAVAPGGSKNQFGDEEPGAPWPECEGRDLDRSDAAFERLALLTRKGYKLAFVWPDRSDKEPGIVNDDELKLTEDAKKSIKKFTLGKFPGGIPPEPA